ncbi:hypothetical protein CQA38_00080 [Campylobacter sp. MIT 12-5580]|uniref:peptidylprolyl isomerase n=1 Tax=Campylobacter sp. MIT 12-5580 TaxID=2040651 RepID=UPI0010F7C043|nr:peptidylprolyl isomerase [Campylobacter sp. MIT 12-5580]TKX30076.1 hypothetical protein CQA38_00080 [Campylobacter sp. MIT 12-5580]
MKKICFFLCFLLSLNHAQEINSIAIIVNKEPITSFEINEAINELKVPRNQAISMLINDRLEESEAKRMGIFINEFELENELNKMLAQSGGSMQSLQASLSSSGESLEDFKEDFKKQMQRKKLYEAVASGAKIDNSEDAMRSYFETHSNEFVLYASIDVNIFSSYEAKDLENLQKGGKKASNVKEHRENLNTSNADPRLLAFLSRLNINEFSPILQNSGELSIYQVKAKHQPQTLPFEQIKEEVANVYINEQRQNFIKDFFDKARAKATIQYLR